jgi:hypothetical protein
MVSSGLDVLGKYRRGTRKMKRIYRMLQITKYNYIRKIIIFSGILIKNISYYNYSLNKSIIVSYN